MKEKVIILLYLSALLAAGIPKDDYWRHLRGNYQETYYEAYLPNFNLWLGYEIILPKHELSYMLIYVITTLCFSIALIRITKTAPENTRIVFLSLFLWLILPRIETARPVVLVSSLIALAWTLKERYAIPIGLSTIPLYWLSWIHLMPLAFKFRKGFLLPVASLIFWLTYSKGEYFEIFIKLLKESSTREILIGENRNPALFLFKLVLILSPLIYIALEKRNTQILKTEKPTLLSALWFILPMQARYMLDGASFFLLSLSKHLPELPKTFVLLSIMLVFFTPLEKRNFKDFPQLEGKVFIADFSQINFELTYRLEKAKITPPMEIKWASKEIYQNLKNIIMEEKFNCQLLCNTKTDWLIEKSLKEIPPCLELYNVYQEYRIWKTKCQRRTP